MGSNQKSWDYDRIFLHSWDLNSMVLVGQIQIFQDSSQDAYFLFLGIFHWHRVQIFLGSYLDCMAYSNPYSLASFHSFQVSSSLATAEDSFHLSNLNYSNGEPNHRSSFHFPCQTLVPYLLVEFRAYLAYLDDPFQVRILD